MKKYIQIMLIFMLSVILFACQGETEEKSDPTTESWKVLYDIKPTSPDFLENVDACYQIFPYSFADSNHDGIGDLKGITENLDYFSDILGVDCLWLNPIHPSPTYHKYDVTNYYGIDRQFGTMSDFQTLIDEAESKGIRILMDLVINHTSSQHPWFINSSIGNEATYRNWYVWNTLEDRTAFPDRTGWYLKNGVYYFASFWNEMPELNYDNPAVREEIKNILTFWLEKGVSGFRIDAAKHIYDTKEFPAGTPTLKENVNYFREFNHHVKTVNPDAFVVGEIYTNGSSYISNFYEGMDSAFNFEFADTITQALQSNSQINLLSLLLTSQTNYRNKKNQPLDSLFLSNHDQNRIADSLGLNMNKMKMASQILMTLPGISWIYYGEEIGMSGVKPDNNIRQPFKWGEQRLDYTTQGGTAIGTWNGYNQSLPGMTEQLLDEQSLLRTYIQMIQIRDQNQILSRGTLSAINHSRSQLLVYVLTYEGQKVLVVHNLTPNDVTINHNLTAYTMLNSTHLQDLSPTSFTFRGYSTLILSINQDDVTFN
jgi:alpha-amylase